MSNGFDNQLTFDLVQAAEENYSVAETRPHPVAPLENVHSLHAHRVKKTAMENAPHFSEILKLLSNRR